MFCNFLFASSTRQTLECCRRTLPVCSWWPVRKAINIKAEFESNILVLYTDSGGSYFDDRGDELFQKRVLQKGGPVMVEEVDEKALDVRAVLILITKTAANISPGIVCTEVERIITRLKT